jgi:hypothetical protein
MDGMIGTGNPNGSGSGCYCGNRPVNTEQARKVQSARKKIRAGMRMAAIWR